MLHLYKQPSSSVRNRYLHHSRHLNCSGIQHRTQSTTIDPRPHLFIQSRSQFPTMPLGFPNIRHDPTDPTWTPPSFSFWPKSSKAKDSRVASPQASSTDKLPLRDRTSVKSNSRSSVDTQASWKSKPLFSKRHTVSLQVDDQPASTADTSK